ncbi:MAG: hypothetical protein M3083_05195 [Actinomycetota bacterium]|nr:hypothetical protein [Actinomycetota bacterium]
MGFFTVMQDNLVVPYRSEVLGMDVTVEDVELNAAGDIVAICSRDTNRQRIAVVDLPVPAEAPEGWEWIDAYRQWRR